MIITKDSKCAVVGYGSWATAIVKILSENIPLIGWYIFDESDLEQIAENGKNPKFLRDVELPLDKLKLSSDINEIVAWADVVVMCVPSAYIKVQIEGLIQESIKNTFIISAVKGIIPEDFTTVCEYINEQYGVEWDSMGVVTGPCHAEEIALERLSYLTMVCKEEQNCKSLGNFFTTKYTQIIHSNDIFGTEYAPIMKNIYALGVGIAVGLGYGDNFIAVLVSNAAMEMNRFMNSAFPFERDVTASCYLGDLLVTCYSQFSRNRTFGAKIGRGYRVEAVQSEMNMIAEGYYAAEGIVEVNKRFGVELPIVETIYEILYKGASAKSKMQELTKRLL